MTDTTDFPALPEPSGWAPALDNRNVYTAEQMRSYALADRASRAPAQEALTFDLKTTVRDYVADYLEASQCGDDWTRGFEECKRRIHKMLIAAHNVGLTPAAAPSAQAPEAKCNGIHDEPPCGAPDCWAREDPPGLGDAIDLAGVTDPWPLAAPSAQANPHSREASAIATLEYLGYTHAGGVQWRPPFGKPPRFLSAQAPTGEGATIDCPDCKGTGRNSKSAGGILCGRCGGMGYVAASQAAAGAPDARAVLETFAHEGRLQTFEDRQRFREAVRNLLAEAATGAPVWDGKAEAIRWLNEVELVQGGANGPTIKLRAAIMALSAQRASRAGPPTEYAMADKIIADYKEHYSFPPQGESHMHDCIMMALDDQTDSAAYNAVKTWAGAEDLVGDGPNLYGYNLARQHVREILKTLHADLHEWLRCDNCGMDMRGHDRMGHCFAAIAGIPAAPPEPDAKLIGSFPRPAGILLTDKEIVEVWASMPGGPDGWLKQFGPTAYAEAILMREHEKRAALADDVRAALDRVTHSYRLLLAGKPVRDAAETLAEADAALCAQQEGK